MIKHGHARRGEKKSSTYTTWYSMKRRCYSAGQTGYENYGGRGIQVCERWRSSFANFLSDMGERPPGTTLGRINNNGNYELGNCRWEIWTVQMRNTRRNNLITFDGVTKTVTDWAEDLGIEPNSLRRRLKNWPLEKCLTLPRRAGLGERSSSGRFLSRTSEDYGVCAPKTHCIHGHELSEENTYLTPKGCRDCRVCIRMRVRAYQQRKAA